MDQRRRQKPSRKPRTDVCITGQTFKGQWLQIFIDKNTINHGVEEWNYGGKSVQSDQICKRAAWPLRESSTLGLKVLKSLTRSPKYHECVVPTFSVSCPLFESRQSVSWSGDFEFLKARGPAFCRLILHYFFSFLVSVQLQVSELDP